MDQRCAFLFTKSCRLGDRGGERDQERQTVRQSRDMVEDGREKVTAVGDDQHIATGTELWLHLTKSMHAFVFISLVRGTHTLMWSFEKINISSNSVWSWKCAPGYALYEKGFQKTLTGQGLQFKTF